MGTEGVVAVEDREGFGVDLTAGSEEGRGQVEGLEEEVGREVVARCETLELVKGWVREAEDVNWQGLLGRERTDFGFGFRRAGGGRVKVRRRI